MSKEKLDFVGENEAQLGIGQIMVAVSRLEEITKKEKRRINSLLKVLREGYGIDVTKEGKTVEGTGDNISSDKIPYINEIIEEIFTNNPELKENREKIRKKFITFLTSYHR